MEFVRRIFGSVDRTYLVRAYVIGGAIFALHAAFLSNNSNGMAPGMWVYMALSTLLFPFSKLVWDELKTLLMGQNMVFMNALLLFFFKLIINVVLWAAAIIIAPLGILYLWARTRASG